MKQLKYIIMGGLSILLGIGLFSCTVESTSEHPVPPQPEGEGYLSVQAGFGLDMTRSIEAGEEFGSTEENWVNSVRIVLYDGTAGVANPVVKYAFDFGIQSKETASEISGYEAIGGVAEQIYKSVDKQSFVTWGRQVARAPYKMLVILNPTTGTADPNLDLKLLTAPGKTLDDLWAAVSTDISKTHTNGGPAEDRNFIMTNHQGLVEVDLDDLYETAEKANENPVSVSVSRMVAKVTVQQGEDYKVTGGTFIGFEWDLDFTNKQTFWMRKMTHYAGTATAEVPGDARSKRNQHYAEDPNFAKISDTDYADHFFSYKGGGDITPALSAPKDWNESTYTLENTMNTASQSNREQRTTVLIRGNYIPQGMSAGDSYFVYSGWVIPVDEMMEYYGGVEEIPSIFPGLGAAIVAAMDEGIDFQDLDTSFEIRGLKYFHEGINYYTVPIQHYGTDETLLGYYGVVRNFHYSVIVDEVYGPGSPTIEPEDLGYLSIRIVVLPWYERSQGHEIGVNNPRKNLRVVKLGQDPDNPWGAPILLKEKYPNQWGVQDLVYSHYGRPGDPIFFSLVKNHLPEYPTDFDRYLQKPTAFTSDSPTHLGSANETVVYVYYPITFFIYAEYVDQYFGAIADPETYTVSHGGSWTGKHQDIYRYEPRTVYRSFDGQYFTQCGLSEVTFDDIDRDIWVQFRYQRRLE